MMKVIVNKNFKIASPLSVTTGGSPALFHVVHLDVGEGVVIESLPPSGATSSLHAAVLANFRTAAVQIHKTLHSSMFAQVRPTRLYWKHLELLFIR